MRGDAPQIQTHRQELVDDLVNELRVHPGRHVLLGIVILLVNFWQVDVLGLLVSQQQSLVQLPSVVSAPRTRQGTSCKHHSLRNLLDALHRFPLLLDPLSHLVPDLCEVSAAVILTIYEVAADQ